MKPEKLTQEPFGQEWQDEIRTIVEDDEFPFESKVDILDHAIRNLLDALAAAQETQRRCIAVGLMAPEEYENAIAAARREALEEAAQVCDREASFRKDVAEARIFENSYKINTPMAECAFILSGRIRDRKENITNE